MFWLGFVLGLAAGGAAVWFAFKKGMLKVA